jgi:hypothetical protein
VPAGVLLAVVLDDAYIVAVGQDVAELQCGEPARLVADFSAG